jgi:hypothetical protein
VDICTSSSLTSLLPISSHLTPKIILWKHKSAELFKDSPSLWLLHIRVTWDNFKVPVSQLLTRPIRSGSLGATETSVASTRWELLLCVGHSQSCSRVTGYHSLFLSSNHTKCLSVPKHSLLSPLWPCLACSLERTSSFLDLENSHRLMSILACISTLGAFYYYNSCPLYKSWVICMDLFLIRPWAYWKQRTDLSLASST